MSSNSVHGVDTDGDSRCAHYPSERDVVALRFGCCERYYACYKCHRETTDHDPEPWPTSRRREPATKCGVCGEAMTADEYVATDSCPNCAAGFNPGCAPHYDRYFEWIESDRGE